MAAVPNLSTLIRLIAHSELRIVSLIPSATEIVAALGLMDFLVGQSLSCDRPTSVKDLYLTLCLAISNL
jgi:ABC-type hemin transport system substrate-binding protein